MKYGLPEMKFNRNIIILLAAVLIMHIGLYIVNPILPVILSTDKGLDAALVGIVIGTGALAFQGGTIIGGLLSDRIGRRTTMIIGAGTQALGLFGYGIVSSFISLMIFSIINGVGSGIYSPALKTAIAALVSESADTSTTAFSLRGIAANIGVSIAGLLILILSGVNSYIVFFSAAGIFLLLAAMSWILLPKNCGGEECPRISIKSYAEIFKNRAFVIFSVVSIFVWAINSQLNLLLPLRGETVLSNGKLVGTIWTVTSIIIIFSQGFISKYILQKINPLTAIFWGVLLFGAGILLIGFSYSFMMLTLSAVIFLVGEMLMLPTTDSLTSQLAHSELLGAYFSISNLISGLGIAIGNFVGGSIINAYGVNTTLFPWIIFGFASAIVSLLVLLTRRLPIISRAI